MTSFVIGLDNEKLARRKARRALRRFGAAGLTDTELLATLLSGPWTGRRRLARRLLQDSGGLAGLLRLDATELRVLGLGPMARSRLLVVDELCRRARTGPEQGRLIADPFAAYQCVWPTFVDAPDRAYAVLVLDAQNRLVRLGGVDSAALADADDIVKTARGAGGVCMIVARNHLKGAVTPSAADLRLVGVLGASGAAHGLLLLDYLIVSCSGYVSLAGLEIIRPDAERPCWDAPGPAPPMAVDAAS